MFGRFKDSLCKAHIDVGQFKDNSAIYTSIQYHRLSFSDDKSSGIYQNRKLYLQGFIFDHFEYICSSSQILNIT